MIFKWKDRHFFQIILLSSQLGVGLSSSSFVNTPNLKVGISGQQHRLHLTTFPTCGHRAISIILWRPLDLVKIKIDWTHVVDLLLCKCQYCKTSIQKFMDSNYMAPFTQLHVFINSKSRKKMYPARTLISI